MDAMNMQESGKILREKRDMVKLVYIDISEEPDDGAQIISELEQWEEMEQIPCILICQEGNILQYKMALNCSRTTDILTAPLEMEQLKRRTAKQL